MIDKNEIKRIISSTDFKISDSELDMIFRQLDYSQNNQINYSEFLAASSDIT